MTTENPYQPPQSNIDPGPAMQNLDEKTFNHLSRGQKMAIYAIALYFFAAFSASIVGGAVAGLLLLIALLLGLVGLVRILMGSKIGGFSKFLLFIAMFLPLINLLALARINHIATKELKAAGRKVGLLGVKGGYAS